jgi:hypothetical protein
MLEVPVGSFKILTHGGSHDEISIICLSVPDPDSELQTRGCGSVRNTRIITGYFLKDSNKILKTISIFTVINFTDFLAI